MQSKTEKIPAAARRVCADPFIVYVVLMLAAFALAFIFQRHPQLDSVRNWQILATVIAAAVMWPARRRFSALIDGPVPRGLWRALFIVPLLAYIAATLCRYFSFKVGGFNFSIFDLMLDNSVHGRFMFSPVCDCNHFAVHLNWILLPLLPVHALARSHFFLLLIHPLVLWAAALPLLKLTRLLLGNGRLSFLVVLAYFANARVGSIIGYSFHPEVFYLLFGFLLILGFAQRRWWLAALATLGFWAVKEDGALYAAAFGGAHLLFSGGDQRRWGAVCLVASLVFFGVNFKVIHPWVQQQAEFVPHYLGNWSHYGSTKSDVLLAFVQTPQRVLRDLYASYLTELMASVLLLPLLGWRGLVAMLPSLLILGTSNTRSMPNHSLYHSSAYLAFFFWALLEGYGRLQRWRRLPAAAATGLLMLALVLFPLFGNGALSFHTPDVQRLQALQAVKAAMDAATPTYCVQTALIPHMSYTRTAQIKSLSAACMATAGAVAIVNLDLAPYPLRREELAALVRQYENASTTDFGSGFLMLRN